MTAGMTAIGAAAGLAPLETAVQGPMGVAPKAGSPPPVQSGASYQKADVGSGKRGRGYGGGLVTQPVATFFASKEMIAFRIQIPDAMRLYKAENGNAPKTHEEFMQKIIAPGRIPLPDLPEGHSYKYDPATEQLMVEHPAP
jgi:hypothetical protein